jgi:hypothetical protein
MTMNNKIYFIINYKFFLMVYIDMEIIKQTFINEFNNYQILEQFSNNESNNKKAKDKRKPSGILKYIMQKKKKLIVYIIKLMNI